MNRLRKKRNGRSFASHHADGNIGIANIHEDSLGETRTMPIVWSEDIL
jgi:hypothetical protein